MKFFTPDIKFHIISIKAKFDSKINFSKQIFQTALQYDITEMFGFSDEIERQCGHKDLNGKGYLQRGENGALSDDKPIGFGAKVGRF